MNERLSEVFSVAWISVLEGVAQTSLYGPQFGCGRRRSRGRVSDLLPVQERPQVVAELADTVAEQVLVDLAGSAGRRAHK